jgi:hypothetical protein
MELPTEEQRRWRELAAELRHDRRLAAHVARFDAIVRWRQNMETARAGIAIPAVIWMPATVGGCLGLGLAIAGTMTRSNDMSAAGMAVLVTTLILAGIALVTIGTAGTRDRDGPGDRR